MDDRHVLRFVNEVSSYLSLLNRHLSDLEGVTDEEILRDHYEQIDALIDSQNNVLNDLAMFIDMISSRLDMYNDAYKDLVARRREEGADAINDDPYTSSILENYKKVPELEQVLKTFSDYKHTIDDTVTKWNANKSFDTLAEIAETTNNAFDEMNAARERYGYVAVDIKDEGQFRRVKVESQGRRVAVNVPIQQFNGGTVNRVIEGAMAASEAKNDHIVSMSLPNGEVISGRFSELSKLAAERMAQLDKEDYIKPEPVVVPEESTKEEEKPVVVEETPVVTPEEPVVEETKPVDVVMESEKVGKHEKVGGDPVIAPSPIDVVGKHEPKPVGGPEIITPAEGEVTPEDLDKAVEEAEKTKETPIVKPDEPVAEETKPVTPEEPVAEETKPVTPAEEPKVEEEKAPEVAAAPIRTHIPPHDRREDVAGDNVVTLDPSEAEVVAPTERVHEERKEKPLKVVKAKASKIKNKKLLISGLATIGLGVTSLNVLAAVAAGFFIYYAASAGINGIKNAHPIKALKEWAITRKIGKVVDSYDDLEFVIDEDGPRIEDHGVEPPTDEDIDLINDELARAVRDEEANWKDIPGIYTRRELEVPVKKNGIVTKLGDKLAAFFGPKEEELSEEPEVITHGEGAIVEDEPEITPVTGVMHDGGSMPTPPAPVAEPAPATPAPVVEETPVVAEPVVEPPKKKQSFGAKLRGFFGIGKNLDEEPEEIVHSDGAEDPIVSEPVTPVTPVAEPAPVTPVTPVVEPAPFTTEPTVVTPDVVDTPEPEYPPVTTTMDEGPAVTTRRNYDDATLMQAAKIINDAPEFDDVRDMISGLFGGLVPGTATERTGFAPEDLDVLYSLIYDEIKFQDLQEYLNSNGYIIDEPVMEIERGVSIR